MSNIVIELLDWMFGDPPDWWVRHTNGKWIPAEGRYEKLERGQFRPTAKKCHEYVPFTTMPAPMYAVDEFKCIHCGRVIPNPKYRPVKAKRYWRMVAYTRTK